jgi:hypothetical protein
MSSDDLIDRIEIIEGKEFEKSLDIRISYIEKILIDEVRAIFSTI